MSPFEVRCYACDVSFPPGTKRCVHCGGPTGPPRDPAEAGTLSWTPGPPPQALEPGAEDEEVVAPAQRMPVRIMTVVWLALAIAASLWRVCAEGGHS
jgi:hypothetical protein